MCEGQLGARAEQNSLFEAEKTNKVSKLDSLLQPLILNYFIITNENVKKLIKYY